MTEEAAGRGADKKGRWFKWISKMAVAELEMALDKEEIQALWAAEHSTSTVGFSTSTSTGLGRGIESATSRRKPGEASRGDSEVS